MANENQKARQGKRYVEPLMQLIAARFTFLYYDTMEKAGFDLKKNANKLLFLHRENDLLKIWRNPDFGFNCRFPVDFERVKSMRKKVLFWNLYLFFADMLPRVPDGQYMFMPWNFFRQVAGRGYQNPAHFQQAVKRELPALIEVYPAIKECISLRNPKRLEFIYADPPI